MEFQYSNSIPHRRRRCWTIFEDIIYIFLFFRIISRTVQSILLLFLPSFAEFFSDQFSSTLLLSAWRQKSPEQHFPRDSRRSRRTSRQSFEVSSWIFLARVNFPPPPAPPCSSSPFFFHFHGTLGRASSRAFSASRGWFTMDDEWWKEKREREREGKEKGSAILWREFSNRVFHDRARKWKFSCRFVLFFSYRGN